MEIFYIAIPLIIFLLLNEHGQRRRWQQRAEALQEVLQDRNEPSRRESIGGGDFLLLLFLGGAVILFVRALTQG